MRKIYGKTARGGLLITGGRRGEAGWITLLQYSEIFRKTMVKRRNR